MIELLKNIVYNRAKKQRKKQQTTVRDTMVCLKAIGVAETRQTQSCIFSLPHEIQRCQANREEGGQAISVFK